MNDKILFSGEFWDINIDLNFGVPGYIFVRNSNGKNDRFSEIAPKEYAEMGKMIGLACAALESCLDVTRVISGKFGLEVGQPLHYHIVPIYGWVLSDFQKDTNYHALQKLNPEGYPTVPDGAELMAYMWRKYCFTGHCPVEVDLNEIISKLTHYISNKKKDFGFEE